MTKKIVITGPESSGKTTLAELLSKENRAPLVTEYAREYLEILVGDYTFDDVIKMAKKQLHREEEKKGDLIVCDTDLTVYHVWIKEKYNQELDWINEHLTGAKNKIYFLCDINDIEWEYDPLREHPNIEDRKRLFSEYVQLLEKNKLTYYIVSGDIPTRQKKCKEIISSLLA